MQTTFIQMHRGWAIYECAEGFYLQAPSGNEGEPIYHTRHEAKRAVDTAIDGE